MRQGDPEDDLCVGGDGRHGLLRRPELAAVLGLPVHPRLIGRPAGVKRRGRGTDPASVVDAAPRPFDRPRVEEILRSALALGASDLHFKAGERILLRVRGDLRALDAPKLTPAQTQAIFEATLESARRGGLVPPYSCEAGNCGTCIATVKEGKVTMRLNKVLSDEEIEEGLVLTCQGMPETTVVVDYDD